jgi:hypothetical protein
VLVPEHRWFEIREIRLTTESFAWLHGELFDKVAIYHSGLRSPDISFLPVGIVGKIPANLQTSQGPAPRVCNNSARFFGY